LLDGTTHLIRIDQPICRISSLAIHLSPTLTTDGLRLNAQQHLVPTLALGQDERPRLTELVLSELQKHARIDAPPDAIAAFDLALFDTQPAAITSADGDLLASARLDNLASCHAATTALIEGAADGDATRGIVLYDHEEVGSQSAAGASSLFLRSVLERVAGSMAPGDSEARARAFARSILISADMAHAIHPNHPDKHDREHAPMLGGGPVVKVNASQAYATDAPGAALFERACRDAGFSAQRFVARNDMRCGSTIGPVSAARLGMRTVDVGNPMLSMHSCREVAASTDVPKMIHALAGVLALLDVPPTSA
jgi:aspartyl aminopeptidase